MSIYKYFRPLIFKLEPEISHDLAIKFLKFSYPALAFFNFVLKKFKKRKKFANLHQNFFNINFDNPIGLAAGFDKNATVINSLASFGFGFLECGTVTPKAQYGNVKPRLFRLAKDEAIINRFGFNNKGMEKFSQNIRKIKQDIIYGINIGKNKDTEDFISDYLVLMEKFYARSSYITVNISSPNTKNLRNIQTKEYFAEFIKQIYRKKKELIIKTNKAIPIFIKIAPDLTFKEQEEIAILALENEIDGLIVNNTSISRDFDLKDKYANEEGGLSGKPICNLSNEVLRNIYKLTQGKIFLIGVGGISSTADVIERIKSGASLVQIYSSLIYQGLGFVEKIEEELSEIVTKEGFKSIKEMIGLNHK